MYLKSALAILFLAAYATAENTVEAHDVPSVCLTACQFTIDLSARCDQETGDDTGYRSCVCTAADSQTRLTECATCVKDNGMSDPDDNDVADLMDDCGWDFNSASASYSSGTGTVTATSTTTPTITTNIITSSSGSVVFTSTQTSTQSALGVESSASSSSSGAAPLATAAVGVYVVGGLAIGIPVWL
ncbi:hypothetical protein F4677DRAFT_444842 [Hypoxylon crocopeplum]|nr:hypothetical protein F4677DRAFT_444842 [Hypoxylon crocopeplum]